MNAPARETTPFLTHDALSAPHGFFTRQGGVSEGIYASLNAGYGAKEDPAENVAENRKRIAAAFALPPENLVTGYQIHSAEALIVESPAAPGATPQVDGLATDRPGMALGVLSADCAPILFEDAAAGVVGACHAGWRGAFGGIAEATLAAMETLGARRERIAAAIGPCIGPAAYEVGPEFIERFVSAESDNQRFFEPKPEGKAFFDLPGYLLARLAAAGIAAPAWIGRCTYAEEALFFSNRRAVHRGEPDYGRLISVIATPEGAR